MEEEKRLPLGAVLTLLLGVALLLGWVWPGERGTPAALAGNICDPGSPGCGGPTPTRTNTPIPSPTRTPPPSPTPGGPTLPPTRTPPPGQPTATPLPPGKVHDLDVCDDPPAPIPAPWVGVADYLVENRCVAEGTTTHCYGVWIVNTHDSLYENRVRRGTQLERNPATQGDMRPETPTDDAHRLRPQCLMGGEWWYVGGRWYYNGTSRPIVDSHPYFSQIFKPEPGLTIRVAYYHAYVPEPSYDAATAWNFGASYVCRDYGNPGPTPVPPPPPPPPTPPPPACPSCTLQVTHPEGSPGSPFLSPYQAVTLIWNCAGAPAGYTVSIWASDGSPWALVRREEIPPTEQRLSLEVLPGFLYRARVDAIFMVGGTRTACCSDDTYYRYSRVLPPTPVPDLHARVDYYSDHDSDPSHGPNNPYRTSGSSMHWNYGEVLHAHPSAQWDEPAYPGWRAETQILKWKYRGAITKDGWHPARCHPPGASSCGWQKELPRSYMHLRWYKYLMPGETEGVAEGDERRWVYATDPMTVIFSFQVVAETTWIEETLGYSITIPFTDTLTMTVRLRYPVTYP